MYKKKLSFCFSMKTALSALELSHVASELQVLVGGKIEKIFQQTKPDNDFLFSVHVPQVGKQYLYATLPDALCLSSFKPSFPQMPPAFCSSLRRKITNAKITAVYQHEFQRILVIELSSKNGVSTLIFELFSTGNVILVDADFKIIATLHQKIWNDQRRILHGQIYQFPSQDVNPLTLDTSSLSILLTETSKDSLVTFLAVECGLGGVYAEYVVSKTTYDKNIAPQDVDASLLLAALKEVLSAPTAPIRVGDEVHPIPLVQGEPLTSFNEGIALLLLQNLQVAEEKQLTKAHRTSLSKFDKVLASQSKQRDGLLASAKLNQETGEAIYNHYQEVKQLLDTITTLRKTHEWKDIKEQLADHPLLVSIDEHKGQIQVKLS